MLSVCSSYLTSQTLYFAASVACVAVILLFQSCDVMVIMAKFAYTTTLQWVRRVCKLRSCQHWTKSTHEAGVNKGKIEKARVVVESPHNYIP